MKTRNWSIRLIGAIASAALLVAACSSTAPQSETSRSTEAADAATTDAAGGSEATSAPDAAAAQADTPDTADTEDTEATEQESDASEPTVPDVTVDPPSVTVTNGPFGVVTGRDDAGEGGVFQVSFTVSDADAVCGFALIDADGASAIHETRVFDESGTDRDIEIAYSVAAGNLPLAMRLGCAVGNSVETVVSLAVEIIGTDDLEAEAPETGTGTSETGEPEKNYENRSANSQFPESDGFYFDHDEIRAAFSDCAPSFTPDWFSEWAAVIDDLYAGWDTEATVLSDGSRVATGWWTDENLAARWTPAPTADEAKQTGVIGQYGGFSLWGTGSVDVRPPSWWLFPWPDYMIELYDRLAVYGYNAKDAAAWHWVTDTGITPHHRMPDYEYSETRSLLFWWMMYRYQMPPINKEPTAWAMRTLLEARDGNCVANAMLWGCDLDDPMSHPYFDSPHMRNDDKASRLGLALWSVACGEGPRS